MQAEEPTGPQPLQLGLVLESFGTMGLVNIGPWECDPRLPVDIRYKTVKRLEEDCWNFNVFVNLW